MGSTTPRIREVLRAGHDRLILCLYSFVLGCSRATSRLFLPAVNWQYLIRYLVSPIGNKLNCTKLSYLRFLNIQLYVNSIRIEIIYRCSCSLRSRDVYMDLILL